MKVRELLSLCSKNSETRFLQETGFLDFPLFEKVGCVPRHQFSQTNGGREYAERTATGGVRSALSISAHK
jgi:hypothetical protein